MHASYVLEQISSTGGMRYQRWYAEGRLVTSDFIMELIFFFHNTILRMLIVFLKWTRGLRRRPTAARLLRLWVRIPSGAWMSVVSVVCCHVEVSATHRSLVQRSPTDCDVSLV